MFSQTVTRTAESDHDPDKLYSVMSRAENIPRWAPLFASSIESIGDGSYNATQSGVTFRIEVALHASARAVDYIREMPDGKRGGAYLRVMPRPLGGSTVTITVPIARNTTEADVSKILEQELAALVLLASA